MKAARSRSTGATANLFVDGRILLDVGVGARDVSFWLVIIEVADEIFDRVTREELLELRVKLRGQCFVVRDDKGRPIQLLDDIGDGECLA